MTIEGIKHYLSDPKTIVDFLSSRGLLRWMSDEALLKLKFRLVFGYPLDLDHPSTFNEKLQWLKLHDRKPEYHRMADKYAVRDYIAEKLGEEYLIPLVGGPWSDPDEIDFDALPDRFVLKTNHDSGGVIVCDKAHIDIPAVKKKLRKLLGRDYYLMHREWPYKGIPRCIIAEKYLEDQSGELTDYKLMCFGGKVKICQVFKGRFSSPTQDFYDENWNRVTFDYEYPQSADPMERPAFMDQMEAIAHELTKDLYHARVDFYYVDGRIYFGELTFYDTAGFSPYDPEEWDHILGSWIELPDQ